MAPSRFLYFSFLLFLAVSLVPLIASSSSVVFAAEPQTREEAKDTDKDGKPDEWRIYLPAPKGAKGQAGDGEKLLRIERDRDGDGRREVVIYFKDGKPERGEIDRNNDGKPDMILFYKEGKQDRQQGDLNFDGKPDFWAYYKNGIKDLVIMDKNHDGKPDAWFYYKEGGQKISGGVIDENFDGKPDRTFGSVPEKETRQPWVSGGS